MHSPRPTFRRVVQSNSCLSRAAIAGATTQRADRLVAASQQPGCLVWQLLAPSCCWCGHRSERLPELPAAWQSSMTTTVTLSRVPRSNAILVSAAAAFFAAATPQMPDDCAACNTPTRRSAPCALPQVCSHAGQPVHAEQRAAAAHAQSWGLPGRAVQGRAAPRLQHTWSVCRATSTASWLLSTSHKPSLAITSTSSSGVRSKELTCRGKWTHAEPSAQAGRGGRPTPSLHARAAWRMTACCASNTGMPCRRQQQDTAGSKMCAGWCMLGPAHLWLADDVGAQAVVADGAADRQLAHHPVPPHVPPRSLQPSSGAHAWWQAIADGGMHPPSPGCRRRAGCAPWHAAASTPTHGSRG